MINVFIGILLGIAATAVFVFMRKAKTPPAGIHDTTLEHQIMRWYIENDVKGGLENLDTLLGTIQNNPFVMTMTPKHEKEA